MLNDYFTLYLYCYKLEFSHLYSMQFTSWTLYVQQHCEFCCLKSMINQLVQMHETSILNLELDDCH